MVLFRKPTVSRKFSRKALGANRAILVIAMVAGLLAFGTMGFRLTEEWPWFECFYCTLMSVSTVGAPPENQLSKSGREFNVVVLLLGLGVMGFAISSFARWVVESELGMRFGRRRMEKEIAALKDHFIICGLGRVGRRVGLEIAQRGIPLVAIEKDPDRAEWASTKNIPVLVGDAASETVLRQAGIASARGLASAVTSDAQNVYITLTARGIARDLPIIARASEEGAESKLMRAGATTVISPYVYAGQRIAGVLMRPNLQHFIDLALSSPTGEGLDLQIEEIKIAGHSKLAGSTLGPGELRNRFGVLLLAIRHSDGRLEFNPVSDRSIAAGDFLIVMGESQKLKHLENYVER
ncbi:MAG: potassium channel family protein [Bryobacteraceae bacterium]